MFVCSYFNAAAEQYWNNMSLNTVLLGYIYTTEKSLGRKKVSFGSVRLVNCWDILLLF